jgi:putative ABC transport system permease protein
VPFHYLGIVTEFPTAPKDSFFVANASYIAAQSGSDKAEQYLIGTGSTAPRVVADHLRAALGASVQVSDIQTTRTVIGSSLTAVDLGGLTRVELGFALVLVAAATGLLLALGFTERRRTFALAGVLGAGRRQLAAFVWSEVLVTTLVGALLGAGLGAALSQMLVKVLTGVFDPPPTRLTVPWAYLGAAAAVAVVVTVLAAGRAVVMARRPPLEVLRDL